MVNLAPMHVRLKTITVAATREGTVPPRTGTHSFIQRIITSQAIIKRVSKRRSNKNSRLLTLKIKEVETRTRKPSLVIKIRISTSASVLTSSLRRMLIRQKRRIALILISETLEMQTKSKRNASVMTSLILTLDAIRNPKFRTKVQYNLVLI